MGGPEPLWSLLSAAELPDTMLVVGKLDTEYILKSNQTLQAKIQTGHNMQPQASPEAVSSLSKVKRRHERFQAEGCGHAVLIEAPLFLLEKLRLLFN